jgi:hypothetical protein
MQLISRHENDLHADAVRGWFDAGAEGLALSLLGKRGSSPGGLIA